MFSFSEVLRAQKKGTFEKSWVETDHFNFQFLLSENQGCFFVFWWGGSFLQETQGKIVLSVQLQGINQEGKLILTKRFLFSSKKRETQLSHQTEAHGPPGSLKQESLLNPA